MTSTIESDTIINDLGHANSSSYYFDDIQNIDIPDYSSNKDAIKQSKIYSIAISVVQGNGNAEDFIAAKDAHYIKLKQQEIEKNSSVKYYKSKIGETNQAYNKATNELKELKGHLSKLEQLLHEINELKESYPPEKQADLKTFCPAQ